MTHTETALLRIEDLTFGDTYANTDEHFWARLLSTREDVFRGSNSVSTYQEPVEDKFQRLFSLAMEEEFEYGIESEFAKGINRLIRENGDDAIRALASFIQYEDVNNEVASEAVRALGRITDPSTYPMRLWLLSHCLFNESPEIRDAASLGLASLDDPQASPYLKIAIEGEKDEGLRENLRLVLEQLEATAQGR
jgi:HEAT repeat protein